MIWDHLRGNGDLKKKTTWRLMWMGIRVLPFLFLAPIFLNAIYTLYVFFVILNQAGFGLLNSTLRLSLIAEHSWEYASFDPLSIVSAVVALVTSSVIWWTTIYLVAQFVLPVSRKEDRKKAAERLDLFIRGAHGAAVFVKQGRLIERQAKREKDIFRPGVVLVDLSSAVTILEDVKEQSLKSFPAVGAAKKKASEIIPKGPGLVFTEKSQKVVGVVDLRPQSRSVEIEAYTRDGIKLSTKISVKFSLSDTPDVICVGYVGDELRGLILETLPDDRTLVKESFALDPQDRQQVQEFLENQTVRDSFRPEEALNVNMPTPYKYYPKRVRAASLKAREIGGHEISAWDTALLGIAVDIFRRELSAIPYNDLYVSLEDNQKDRTRLENGPGQRCVTTQAGQQKNEMSSERFPGQSTLALTRLRETFARNVKMKGIIHIQFVYRKRGTQSFEEGEILEAGQLVKSPAIELRSHSFNSLRNQGIVVKSASFGTLNPVNESIKMRMIENWRSKWEKEIHLINAEYDLEAIRVRNRNRAQIQQEMTYLLANILQGSHTDEALALRVFQALEAAATNPTAQSNVSPKEIMAMLDSLHKWLLLERKDFKKPTLGPLSPSGGSSDDEKKQ